MLGFAFQGRSRIAHIFCALVASVALIPVSHAAEHRFSLLFDTDNVAGTGCTVSTANGPVSGIERIATAVVSTTTTTATVARLEQQTCTGGTLSAATTYDAGGWSAGLGNGPAGSAAIEFSVPLTSLPRGATVKALATSRNALGQEDATGSFLINISNAIAVVESVPVPLSRGLAALLAAMVAVTVALRFRRQHSSRLVTVLMAGVILSTLAWAATVVRDGNISDWAGVSAAVTDASGDAPTNADIRAVYHQQDDNNLYVRIDADVRLDAPPNLAPVVNAGANQTITLPATATLAGTASDDGLPNPPATLTISWSKVSGPGTVTFANANAASTSATFGLAGSYLLRLTASDSVLSTSSDVTVTVNPVATVNTAPVITNLPATAIITLPINTVSLPATVTDDGLPNPPATVTKIWSKVSGPGTVTFANPATASTTATFSAAGSYVLRLTASDSLLTTTQDITVTVNPVATVNTAPVIANLPATALTTLPANTVSLPATVTDDGLPNPPATVSTLWSKVSGPGTVTFANPAAASTTATFSAAGSYVLRLTANDSLLSASQDITVTVNPLVVGNTAPVISNLPAAQTITLPTNTLSFTPTVVDDGLPNPPSTLTYAWSKVSGPSTPAAVPYALTFSATDTKNTTVTFDFGGVGAYVLRLTVSDGALTTSQDVAVTLLDAPAAAATFGAIPNKTVKVGDTLRFVLAANDPNYQQTLAYSLLSAPTGATLGGAGNALFSFTPSKSQVGNHPVTVQVADNTQPASLTASKSFTITVVDANQPPAFTAPSKADDSVLAGATFTRALSATDPDAGDTLTYSLVSGPPGMTVSAAGALSWTSPSVVSVQTATIKVTDSAGNFDLARFSVAALPSAAPVAVDDAYRVQVGQTLNVNAAQGVLLNDIDPASLPLTASKQSDPAKGALSSFNANGSFTYVAPAAPAANAFNPEQVRQLQISADSGIYNWQLADLNGDGYPDLVFLQTQGVRGNLKAFDIKNNAFLWQTDASADGCWLGGANKPFKLAIGDLDDDGIPDIAMVGHCSGQGTVMNRILAFDGRTGAMKWKSDNVNAPGVVGLDTVNLADFGQPLTIARLRAGEKPSVVLGVAAFSFVITAQDGNGNAISRRAACEDIVKTVPDGNWQADATATAHYYSCVGAIILNGQTGAITQRMIADGGLPGATTVGRAKDNLGMEVGALVADFNGSGQNKIALMGAVWNLDGTRFGNSQPVGTFAAALGNFDDSPDIEIVSVEYLPYGPLQLRVKKADGRVLWSMAIPTFRPGDITVTDLDGDGKADILLNMAPDLWAINHRGQVRWIHAMPCGDCYLRPGWKSRPMAFDLDGDGVPEVVTTYRNELRFIDGLTGALKASRPTFARAYSNGAWDYEEMARIVDVDADGHADIVTLSSVVRDACCGPDANTSVLVFSDAAKQWRPTRKIDNQWQYHGSNVNDNGTIPTTVPLPNTFATTGGNIFGTQPQILAPVDPRLRDQTSFTYSANNGALSSLPATVKISIEPQNRPPKFTSTPPTRHNGSLSYQATAVDPDVGDTLTYAIVTQLHNAQSCSIGSATGLLTCPGLTVYVPPVDNNTDPFFVISATDSLGATALQSFTLKQSTTSCTVPNVAGLTQTTASTAITAAGCSVGDVSESYSSTIAAGQVISQSPSATTVILGGEAVSLLVSKGLAPVVVPLLVGKAQTLASNALTGLGFTPTVSYVYSSSVARGVVVSQSPVAGTTVSPASAALSVSIGNGLSVQLSQDVITAGKSATIRVMRTGLDGVDAPYSGATLSITPLASTARGALPTLPDSTVSTSATTRGIFRITATDSLLALNAAVDLVVGPPDTVNSNIDTAAIAKLSEVTESVRALLVQAQIAPDIATKSARAIDAVNLWRSMDQWVLRRSTPVATETGFPFSVADLTAAGESATVEDILTLSTWERATASLENMVTELNEPGTTLAALDARAAELSAITQALSQTNPTKFGLISTQSEHTAIVSTLIPDLMDALMNDLGQTVGLARETPKRLTGGGLKSTLGEQLVTLAVNNVLERINLATQLRNAAMKAAKQGGALLILAGQLRSGLAGDSLEAVVSGASLSFHLFKVPGAFIEGHGFELKYPYLNDIIMIGPDAVDKVLDASSAISGLGSAQSMGAAIYGLLDVFNKLKGALGAADDVYKNGLQKSRQSDRNCIFTAAATCGQLLIRDGGFDSVYEFQVLDAYGKVDSLPIPLPIITIVRSGVSGRFSFATPAFLPTQKFIVP